jgi:hypothetical protein
MIEPIAAAFGWFVLGWACRGLQLERLGRNSNGNCVPLPPAPPYSSAAIAWQAEAEASRANDTARAKHSAELYAKFIDSSVGEPWPEPMTVEKWARRGSNPPPPGRKPAPPAGPPVRFDEGRTQRGNGSGGTTTPKPPIKPQPSGGRMVDQSGMTIGYQPLPRSGRTLPPPREP